MFTNTSIKFRLMFVMSILSVLIVGIGGLGLYGFNQSNMALKTVYEDRTVTAIQLGKILDVWYQVRNNAIDGTQSKNIDTAKVLAESANKLVKQNEAAWSQYLVTFLTPEEERLAKVKGEQYAQYVQSMNRVFQLAITGDFEAATQNLSTDTAHKFSVLRDTVFALLDLQGSTASEEYINSQSSYENIGIVN